MKNASLAAVLFAFALGACQKNEEPKPAATTGAQSATPSPAAAPAANGASLHAFTVKRLDGKEEPLSAYKGKVLLVVNTASQCGFTPQYAGLQKLHEELSPKGFSVLGFPSNDFGAQEPGTSQDIATFCDSKYHVTFPMFEKVVTKGADASPVYAFLAKGFGAPEWNFHKYVVGKDGKVVKAFPSKVKPESDELRKAIDDALSAG